jgi:hypothetical protein
MAYHEKEFPLPAPPDRQAGSVDLVLDPEAVELDGVSVPVRNERVVDWLSLVFGANPTQFLGFRIIQGARLDEAKLRGRGNPTETLRWLYVPVWHGGPCVSINVSPRAASAGSWGPRPGAFGRGGAPAGTLSLEERLAGPERDRCGRLFVDGRLVPNGQIERVDMSSIAVVTTLAGEVRMFTHDFDWAFRPR